MTEKDVLPNLGIPFHPNDTRTNVKKGEKALVWAQYYIAGSLQHCVIPCVMPSVQETLALA